MKHGGARANAGRKPLSEELEEREKLRKLFPKALAFYEEIFNGRNDTLKERVSHNIINKFIADKKADEEQMRRDIEEIKAKLNI